MAAHFSTVEQQARKFIDRVPYATIKELCEMFPDLDKRTLRGMSVEAEQAFLAKFSSQR